MKKKITDVFDAYPRNGESSRVTRKSLRMLSPESHSFLRPDRRGYGTHSAKEILTALAHVPTLTRKSQKYQTPPKRTCVWDSCTVQIECMYARLASRVISLSASLGQEDPGGSFVLLASPLGASDFVSYVNRS